MDCDMCIAECTNLLYLRFIFERFVGLVNDVRSSARLPPPLFRFQDIPGCNAEVVKLQVASLFVLSCTRQSFLSKT